MDRTKKIEQGGIMGAEFSVTDTILWTDVGGMDELRKKLKLHIVERIKNPELFQKYGITIAPAILLFGPPGCGKTLIVKAVVYESGANFIHIQGRRNRGEDKLTISRLFSQAKKYTPCVLFFDEIDALITEDEGTRGHLVSQLFVEMEKSERVPGLFIIGATNRPHLMDYAYLQPHRFEERVYVPLPSSEDRGLILNILARGMPVDSDVDLGAIGRSKDCEVLNGADLGRLLTNAAIAALDEEKSLITVSHLEKALAQISPSITDKELGYYREWSEYLLGRT